MSEPLNKILIDLGDILNRPLMPLGEDHLTLAGILKLLILAVLVFVVERFLRRLLVRRLLRRTHLEHSLQFAISRFVGHCFITLGLFVGLKLVGIDLSSLAVIVGAIGVGVGFGLQKIISNFVSGLIILAERVVTNDNITIIVPNSNFITSPVTNWSHGDPKVRLRLDIGVAYGTDLEKLQRVLLEVAAENPDVL